MSDIAPATTSQRGIRILTARLWANITNLAKLVYRPHSIRWQLIAWQAVILTAVVLGFGSTLYWQARSATIEQVDADLLGVAQVLVAQLQQPNSKDGLAIPETYRHRLGLASRDAPYFAIWDAAGKSQFVSEHAPKNLQPEPNLPANKGPHPFHSRYRGVSREVIVAGPDDSQILVGRPLHRENNYFRRLLGWVLGTGIGVLALGLAGAWLLARAIVAPLEKMTATAEQISATNLSERIAAPNPRSETGRLALVLNQMFDRLQAAFERQSQFTADASHELRTPVSVVLSHSELALSKDRSPVEYKQSLEACYRASKRMKVLVDGLLTLARADAGQLEMRRESADLRQIVQSTLSLLKPLSEQRQLEIESDLQPVNILGDAERLSQVVANLVSNAIAYNRDGGKIHVSLAGQDTDAVLTIADTGVGIDAEDLPKIFERFYRVDKARSGNRGGSGLGLPICQEIVRSHSGSIEVSSAVGQGTTFIVRLPTAMNSG